mmetsp:Transcript_22395/g.53265  ORF Transcript_22395/g.53265 Transcript_22395/m.53265 type:complete len:822 (-) Transcript_22395:367-2832(-)|eukprot:CAMPEP_0197194988 /NCGR_PEP_ID=MMETSP1423-20130617/30252_1 /TAXON_ID=476441 /ORGANISM="Pseudo-nitzschia heimii, Strain UNC1101" /LENGTH=821 /DNA_ID=CAMNT_0042648515 /DNA_START=49 /DNA_END=2514 /DNA_ORIENTATION=-
MSFNARDSFLANVRQEQRDHHRDVQLQRTDEVWTWTFVEDSSQNRVSNSQDETEESREGENDENLVSKIEFDKSPSMSNPREPVVRYSTRKPNYPTGYSCEHSLLYNSNPYDQDVAKAVAMLSHSEDSDDVDAPVLNRTQVRLSLEFEILVGTPDDYDEIVSNVEALQWSLLNEISARTGLSKGCKISYQYDAHSLVTAFTNLNDQKPVTNEIPVSNEPQPSSNNNYSDDGDSNSQSSHTESSHDVSSSSYINDSSKNDYNYRQNENNRRARQLRRSRRLQSTLKYPTSVYSIFSTRPKWTASCSSELMSDEEPISQCFTAEITFDVKYRGSIVESNLIEEYIQSIVHNQLALDPKQLFAEDIIGLTWKSNEEASRVFDPPESEQVTKTPIFYGPDDFDEREIGGGFLDGETGDATNVGVVTVPDNEIPKDATSNDLFASLTIPIGTAVFLCAIWYCIHMRYKREGRSGKHSERNDMAGFSSPKEQKDIETGSVSTEITRKPVSKSSSDTQDCEREPISKSSPDTKDCEKVRSCTGKITKKVGLSPAASIALQMDPSPSKSVVSKGGSSKSCPISVDSPERTAAGLPPRPMVVKREVNKQLKQRRKKKKKRKKRVLSMTRVSSRDNIVEMPMISESESECDSEYTSGDEEYCDDGSSYDASSGCLSPSGSTAKLSRSSSTGSIAISSPQKSPRNNSFSSKPVEGPSFEFVMEVPEFPDDAFIQPEKKPVLGVDENLPPNLMLRPKPNRKSEFAKPKSVEGDDQKSSDVSLGSQTDRQSLEPLEIADDSLDLDRSFVEENGSIMERMLPLPWLATYKSNRMN